MVELIKIPIKIWGYSAKVRVVLQKSTRSLNMDPNIYNHYTLDLDQILQAHI